MAMRSLFFNSAPGDQRTYQASDLAWYFNLALSTGLVHTDNVPAMQVRCEGTDLRTYIEPGTAIMQGYAFENTANEFMQHALPEATMDRIDRIVLRLDKRNQSRWILPFVKQGVADASPVPPTLQRDNFVYELSLAQIRVRANTASLNPADLIDERLDEQLCGIVNSLLSVPTSQFQAQWDAFMASVQSDGFTPLTTFNAHKDDYVKHPAFATATGTANAYAVTLDPAPNAYVDGMGIAVAINIDATGASTLNVNGLGAIPIKKANGTDVTNLKANGVYTVRYNSATGNFILQGEGASGNANASDLLSGKTATTDAGEITGTMTDRGAMTITPSRTNQAIPIGYHNGSGIISGDADLIAANIKNGINIFGVVGSLVEGARVATGTTTAASGILTVTGLAFQPVAIVVWHSVASTQNYTVWVSGMSSVSLIDRLTIGGITGTYTFYGERRFDSVANGGIKTNGFVIPVTELNAVHSWRAIG